jgi:putative SOS response-associated peptidase YedK
MPMCGRFVSRVDAAVERAFGLTTSHWRPGWGSFNVAPSQPIPVVRAIPGGREGVMLRWGLVPAWAHGEPGRYSTINARAETVTTAASYRGPWRKGQRCVIPALGFYEWQVTGNGKQPWFIQLAGGEAFGLAGLWETSQKPDGTAVESCTIITVPANPLVAHIHAGGRMPAIIPAEACEAWLSGSGPEALQALASFPADAMDAWPVSTRVNSPRNDDARLLERAG